MPERLASGIGNQPAVGTKQEFLFLRTDDELPPGQTTDGMPDAFPFDAMAFRHDLLVTAFEVAVKVQENGQFQPGQGRSPSHTLLPRMMFFSHGHLRSVVQGIAVGQIPELPVQLRVAVNAVERPQGTTTVDVIFLWFQGNPSPNQVFLNPVEALPDGSRTSRRKADVVPAPGRQKCFGTYPVFVVVSQAQPGRIMNEVHLSPVGEFNSLHAANVVHDPGRFRGQLETGRNHLVSGMAHMADVDGGNTCPDNQTVGTDQPEDPGHELVGAAAVVTVDHDHFDALLTVVFQHVPVGEANQVLAGRSTVRFPGTLFLGADDEETRLFHLVKQRVGGNEAVLLRAAVVLAVGEDGGRDTPDLVSIQRAVVSVAIEFACGCVSIHIH